MTSKRIAITGASGLIGTAVSDELIRRGHEITPMVRDPAAEGIYWNPATGEIDASALEGTDAVIHLAGANVGQRWTKSHRRAIRDSRIEGTGLLAETLAGLSKPPSILVCASASGYYGDAGDAVLDEQAPKGDGFLADVVADWEAASEPAREAGIRTVRFRQAMVLSTAGGALARLAMVVRLGIGGPLGSGKQWWSWIDIEDVATAYAMAVESPNLDGTYNLASPEPLRNAEFVRTLAKQLRRPSVFPTPAFALRLAQGRDLADQMLLASQRLSPARLQDEGFQFGYPTLAASLAHRFGSK